MVLLVVDGGEVPLGHTYGRDRCDLQFVEDLLLLRLAAHRLGWSIRLTEVRSDLRELVEMVGLASELVD